MHSVPILCKLACVNAGTVCLYICLIACTNKYDVALVHNYPNQQLKGRASSSSWGGRAPPLFCIATHDVSCRAVETLVLNPDTNLRVTTIAQPRRIGSGDSPGFLCPLPECRQTNQIAGTGVCG